MNAGEAFAGTLGLALIVLAILVAILWVFLPFAVFGTKDILREILAQLKQINEKLTRQ
jgi:membrane protein insertase Oxa1/YidC/SpoIIIJ